jgi:hypothetical protein
MRKFKILVIAHSLKQNKVAKYGDIVSEIQLTSPASELMEAGFIQEFIEEVSEVSEQAADNVKKEIKDIKGNKK